MTDQLGLSTGDGIKQQRKILIKGLDYIATFDDEGQEIARGDILIDGPAIAAVGPDLPDVVEAEVIDGRGLIALPGLINSHQHLYQGALRAIPDLERVEFPGWIAGMAGRCLRWWRDGEFSPELVGAVARAVLLESLMSGVTTVADQHYFHPSGRTQPFVEATIDAARELGIRFHAGRGTLTLGRSLGGAADDGTVQQVDEVVRHCLSLVEDYHDPGRYSMTRVSLAPCGAHVDLPDVYRELAAIAMENDGVRLHTHLYSAVDALFCDQRYGQTPWEFLANNDWANDRVWLAHVVNPAPPVHVMRDWSALGVSVSLVPTPDLRVGWGIAPLRDFLDCGVNVGFGTTGAASNDASNLLGDMRVGSLVHRATTSDPARWPSSRELLRMGTRGSAACLGRGGELGTLAPGYAADIACWDMTGVDRVGVHDPVIGLVLTGLSTKASLVIVNGEVLIRDGKPTRVSEEDVVATATALLSGTREFPNARR